MTVSDPSPIRTPRTSTTVSSGWNSREVSLNGRLIGVTLSTPGMAANRLTRMSLRGPISPSAAMTTRSIPRFSCAASPSARIRLFTPLIWSSLASGAITTNIDIVPSGGIPGQRKKQRRDTSAHPARPAIRA